MRSSLFYGCFSVLLVAPAAVLAGHFNEVKLSIKLVDPDSINLEVNADCDDLLNTAQLFPDNQDTAAMRLYQVRTEAYLVSRLPLKVDGKGLPLKVVQWKPGGKGRDDGFDSTSIYAARQVITLGARLPKTRKSLTLRSDLWIEYQHETLGEIAWYWNGALLDRRWSFMEKNLTYPLQRDSLVAARERARRAPPPASSRPEAEPEDHED